MASANDKKRDSARMQVRRYVMDLIYRHSGEAVRLPSNKDLAEELGIARSTAQLELKCLLEEGFLETRHGIGTFAVPRAGSHSFEAPLIGILDGDGKIIYEPFYRWTLRSHIGIELAKLPATIQEVRLFSERENDLFEELRSIRCDMLVCIEPSPKLVPLLQKLQACYPVLTADSTVPGIAGVELDRRRKGVALGKALLADGRRNIIFSQNRRYRETTFRGCRDTFAAAGIAIPEAHFFDREPERLEELLRSGFRPDAVVPSLESADAITALLRRYGIDLNRECRLATFMFKPKMAEPVMLFDFPFAEFGRRVAGEVKKRLENPALPPEQLIFDVDYPMHIV
ncbi:MAG: hypothetical protein HPZ91_06545 [Lentisphaeria bacterium]|nr:hypothetical protein [Lentisphaeria bacterium]